MSDLKEIGNQVLEALALQGKVNGATEKVVTLNEKIDANDKEVARLNALKTATVNLVKERDGIIKQLGEDKKEFKSRQEALKEAGVSLSLSTPAPTNMKL